MRGTVRTMVATAMLAFAGSTLMASGAMTAHAADGDAMSDHAPVAKVAAGDDLGCPSGYVCIVHATEDLSIEHQYYRYGVYNLSNEYNGHIVDNNQTDNAHVDLCYGYNGVNCFEGPPAGDWEIYDLTPINSIRLRP
jgi:hypothetical protein